MAPSRTGQTPRLTALVLTIQGLVLGVACAWAALRNIPLWNSLVFYPLVPVWGILLGLGIFGFNLLASRLPGPWRPAIGWIYQDLLHPLFSPLSNIHLVGIAAASGFCEELLFRGVIQTDLGLVLASLLFGIFHTGEKRLLILGPWAAAAGLALGWSYTRSESLWVPILGHFINNLCALLYLKHFYRAPLEPPPPEASPEM